MVLPPGPYQRADAGAEAAGDPEPAPAAAADAAAAAAGAAAADTDDARAGLEYDPQHGGRRWHTSNHEQSADPAGQRTAVSVSSKLWYWFHPPRACQQSLLLHVLPSAGSKLPSHTLLPGSLGMIGNMEGWSPLGCSIGPFHFS